MKNAICILMICLCFSLGVSAQENFCGIFKNGQDYRNGSPSIKADCASHSKIKANLIFSEKYIEIKMNGAKSRFMKDSVFGYRDCHQNDYRFFKGDAYQIKENKAIVIYSMNKRVYSSSGKTYELKPDYFFSNGLNGRILLLTIQNLKKAFPNNIKFHDSLDVAFGDGAALSTLDTDSKMFKVNYLLNESTINIK